MDARSTGTIALLLWLALPATALPQTRYQVTVQAVGGLYVHNSENSLPLLQEGKFIGGYGINASVVRSTTRLYSMALDVQYFRSNANGPLEFYYSLGGPQAVSTFYGRVALDQLSADAGLRRPVTKWLQVGLGPSFAMESRTVDFPYASIADRLNSYCLGLHVVAAATLPLDRERGRGFFCYYTLKLRYLHSLFFDARGRDLSNYSHSFLTASLGAGIGYSF